MSKLKKCPFCGGEARLLKKKERGSISGDMGVKLTIFCTDCGCKIEKWALREEWAIESAEIVWNDRQAVQQIIEKLEELKKAEYDDSDEEPEFTDAEEWFDEGESSGRFKAYGNAIKLIKEGLN